MLRSGRKIKLRKLGGHTQYTEGRPHTQYTEGGPWATAILGWPYLTIGLDLIVDLTNYGPIDRILATAPKRAVG